MEFGSIQPGQPVDLEQAKLLIDSVARGNGQMLEASRLCAYLACALIAGQSFWTDDFSDTKSAWILAGLVLSVLASVCCHFFVGFTTLNGISKFLKGKLKSRDGMKWIFTAWLSGTAQVLAVLISIVCILFG